MSISIWDGPKLLAIFVRADYDPPKTRFLTENSEPLQFGIGVFPAGHEVMPHRHTGKPVNIDVFQEFILLPSGKAIAKVYNEEGGLISSMTMKAGDSLLLLRGGHGFTFLEPTQLLEIKQGPFLGTATMKAPLPKIREGTPEMPPQHTEPPPNLVN